MVNSGASGSSTRYRPGTDSNSARKSGVGREAALSVMELLVLLRSAIEWLCLVFGSECCLTILQSKSEDRDENANPYITIKLLSEAYSHNRIIGCCHCSL